MKETTVIIIGGGATGIGILRDLSMRGVPALLLEQGGLAHGTSSRFHGRCTAAPGTLSVTANPPGNASKKT